MLFRQAYNNNKEKEEEEEELHSENNWKINSRNIYFAVQTFINCAKYDNEVPSRVQFLFAFSVVQKKCI